MTFAWIFAALAPLAGLYALHRLLLCLERVDWKASWRAGTGGGYHPLMEIYQPQIRHVVQVEEQRLGESDDDAGVPE